MILTLKQFCDYFEWKKAKITYLQLVGKNVHMDVYFVPSQNKHNIEFEGIKSHIVFDDVVDLTDEYYSSLEKIISRFKNPYICSKVSYNEGYFILDDALKIKCEKVEINECQH